MMTVFETDKAIFVWTSMRLTAETYCVVDRRRPSIYKLGLPALGSSTAFDLVRIGDKLAVTFAGDRRATKLGRLKQRYWVETPTLGYQRIALSFAELINNGTMLT